MPLDLCNNLILSIDQTRRPVPEHIQAFIIATLYTFGYRASKSKHILQKCIEHRVPVIDIRFNPYSNSRKWHKSYLERLPGLIYIWVPALGNELYKDARQFAKPHITLHDLESGLATLQTILLQHKRAVIFCACNNRTRCHRIEVARIAEERLGVQVRHL